MKWQFAPFAFSLAATGCAHTFVPQTPASVESGYTYIPVDPFSVRTEPGDACIREDREMSDEKYEKLQNGLKYRTVLESLPDNAVRMSIEQFDASGTVTYGPAGFGSKGESYRVTVDYVNSDTTNFSVWIAKSAKEKVSGKAAYVDLVAPLDSITYEPRSVSFEVLSSPPLYNAEFYGEYNIPIYVGIGLRVTANIDVIGGTANISGLGVIGAEAEANSLKGSLIVQTLGINGKSIAAALPIQSELNRTTAQNAIVSVGSIKALLYDDKTITSPRVVGMYLPFPGGKPVVNAIISELSKEGSIVWRRPCVTPSKKNGTHNITMESDA